MLEFEIDIEGHLHIYRNYNKVDKDVRAMCPFRTNKDKISGMQPCGYWCPLFQIARGTKNEVIIQLCKRDIEGILLRDQFYEE